MITLLLTYAKALSGRHFNVTQRKNLEIQMSSITKYGTLLSLNIVNRKFLEGLLSDETKTSEGMVIFNFG